MVFIGLCMLSISKVSEHQTNTGSKTKCDCLKKCPNLLNQEVVRPNDLQARKHLPPTNNLQLLQAGLRELKDGAVY